MINASEFCVFYYNCFYLPPKRKRSSRELSEYQPKSGTALAFEYAYGRKRARSLIEILNVFLGDDNLNCSE